MPTPPIKFSKVILSDADLETAAGIFLEILHRTAEVALSIFNTLANGGQDDRAWLAWIILALYALDPDATNSLVLDA